MFRQSFTRSLVPSFLNPFIDSRDDQIHNQMDVLNQAYSQTGLNFELQSINKVPNEDWFNNVAPRSDKQTAMKQELRKGDANALNVYTVGFNTDRTRGLLGYATFPANYSSNPMDDGIVVRYSTLPGGSAAPYNEGQTITHEVGHWVGLYHTFQGGCDGDGDHVDDTPAEAEPAQGHVNNGCDVGRDTCPKDPGSDREQTLVSLPKKFVSHLISFLAVQNYMDYSDDACMNNFTPGQVTRLKNQIATFRNIYV